jgi:ZIP family zinc transporter
MGAAFFWGFVGGAALLIGAATVYVFRMPSRVLGAIMAFGAGVLISAVSFELVQEATDETDGDWVVFVGLIVGSLVFFVGDWLIDRSGGKSRKSASKQGDDSSGPAILLGTILDGIPESIVIGLGLVGGGPVSAAMVAAVFLSNLPEAIGSTTGLRESGWSAGRMFTMWGAVAVISGLSSLLGFAVFDTASSEVVAFVLAFAGGALLTMLADTMIPEAYELDKETSGLILTIGFGIAYAISAVS